MTAVSVDPAAPVRPAPRPATTSAWATAPVAASSVPQERSLPQPAPSRTPIADRSDSRDPFHHVRLILLAEEERGNTFIAHRTPREYQHVGVPFASGSRALDRGRIEAEFALPATAKWTEYRGGRLVLRIGAAELHGARPPRSLLRRLAERWR